MTKKHFNLIALSLNGTRPEDNWDANKKVQWNLDVKVIANVCGSFNSNFDYHRFIDACGGLFDI